jgi:hypothetical protein
VSRSPGLGNELGFIPVDPHTLQGIITVGEFYAMAACGQIITLPGMVSGQEPPTGATVTHAAVLSCR